MEYIQDLILDLNSNTSYTTVGVKQGDHQSRILNIHLTQNGEDYIIEEGVTAYFRFRKPDGKAIVNTARIEENTIHVGLTSQMLAAPGRGYADITLQQGATVLSTVSFIIIVMAAPGVLEQIVSSNEFGYLNDILAGANDTIYESEAWAIGTRGGTPVESQYDVLVSDKTGLLYVTVMQEPFLDAVGHKPGLLRYFTFTFVQDETWNLVVATRNGSTETKDNPELISGLEQYSIEVFKDTDLEPGDWFTIKAVEPDLTYDNNAKYYSEEARKNNKAISDLQVSASRGENAEVTKTWDEEMEVWHLDFTLPKGDRGDVNIMTFDVDTETGELMMYTPTDLVNQVTFEIADEGDNEGCLMVTISGEGGNE